MPSASAKPRTLSAAKQREENAVRALVRAFGLLERVMQPYFGRFGITGAQWGVLRALDRAEEAGLPGLRLTDLSDRLLVRPPSVTGVVDRLERAGLVVRDASPTDLRAKQVRLTPRGRQRLEQVLAGHGEQMDAVLSDLAPAERRQLQYLLDRLGRHLQEMLEPSVPLRAAELSDGELSEGEKT